MDNRKFDFQYRNAIKTLEQQLFMEKKLPMLADQLNIQSNALTISGLKDGDYPVVNEYISGSTKITKTCNIPFILKNQIKKMKQNFIMKTFIDIDRLCLTVDSNLFLWNYEICGEPEIYNEIPDSIVCINLIKPKRGVFYHTINYLLIACTLVEVFVIGVIVHGFNSDSIEFTRESIFRLSTDNEEINVIESINGRIFMGTQSGKIIELTYWTEKPAWLSISNKSCHSNTQYAIKTDWNIYMKSIDHTSWMISMFLPSLIVNSLSNTSGIIQIAPDPTRNCFYTLSDNSTITEYQLLANNGIKQGNYVTESSTISKIFRVISFVEKDQFKNIVHLAPLPKGYGLLKLVAVTQNGMRFYFIDDMRLCHVRMPPVNSLGVCGKIGNVRYCCESRGSTLLTSGPQGQHSLYIISPDQFMSPDFIETVSLIWLQQTCWSLQALDKSNAWKQAGPPIIQTQHIDPIRQFILLTNDNVLIIELASPIHQLKSLIDKPMSSSHEIKSWINHYGLDETIYAALVLSMDVKKVNPTLASKAVDLVIYYLSENVSLRLQNVMNCGFKYEIVNPLHNLLFLYAARIMRPLWDSCLIEQVFSVDNNNQEQYETTHDFDQLIYYISHLVHLHTFIHDNYPRIKSIDMMNFPNSSGTSNNGPQSDLLPASSQFNDQSLSMTMINQPIKSLSLELAELLKITIEIVGLWRLLTEHNFQRIVTYLPPEIRRELLTTPIKHILLPSKQHVLLSLISALLEYYLEDGSSTDRIIETLLHICPNIYRLEDAMCSKANELLVTIDALTCEPGLDQEQLYQKKNDILTEAIGYYEKVGANIELGSVVYRLRSVGCMWGPVYLCMNAAKLRDPDEIAFLCLREVRRPQTQLEISAVEGRNDAYKYMLECLSSLLALCTNEQLDPGNGMPLSMFNDSRHNNSISNQLNITSGLNSNAAGNQGDILNSRYLDNRMDASMVSSNSINSKVWYNPSSSNNDAWNELNIVLTSIFNNKSDIMAHYEVYSWMMDNNMSEDILKYEQPADHLESFLQRCLTQYQTTQQHKRHNHDNRDFYNTTGPGGSNYHVQDDAAVVNVKNLLWKHYEMQRRFYDAARVLDSMAVDQNSTLKLQERVECLSRAIVFIKAVIADRQFVDSDFLKELEDKVEIANLQKVIIDEAGSEHPDECKELSSQLFNVYTLLKEYVEPLDLSISKLCILKITGNDVARARLVWEDVISKEINVVENEHSRETKMTLLKQAISRLINAFKENSNLIPLDVILNHLEIYSGSKEFPDDWTVNCLISAGIPIDTIILSYGDVVKMKTLEIKKFINRIYTSICHLLDLFMNQEKIRSKCAGMGHQLQDVITYCLIQLQSKPDSVSRAISSKFSAYQSQIDSYNT